MRLPNLFKWLGRGFLILVIGALTLIAFGVPQVQAKPEAHAAAQSVTITIDGPITSINNNVWVVGGVSIQVTAQTVISGQPIVGNFVHVVGTAGDHNAIIAQSITLIPATTTPNPSITPTSTFTDTPGPSPTPTIAAATGTITTTPGATATPIPYVTIVIEGPVESINVNVIVVFNQRIKLKVDDPILPKLKVGDWVKISGNHGLDDDNVTVIVVAVVVVVVNPPPPVVVIQPPNNNNSGDDDGHGHHKGDDDDD